MLGGEGLQGHFEKQIATWCRNWFPPPRRWLHDASFDCVLSECLTEIISAIPRVTLSFSPGQLCLRSDFVHVKAPPGRILGGKSSSVRSRYWTAHSPPFSFQPTLPNRQTRLFISPIIMNEAAEGHSSSVRLYLCGNPYYLLVHVIVGDNLYEQGSFIRKSRKIRPCSSGECSHPQRNGKSWSVCFFLVFVGFFFSLPYNMQKASETVWIHTTEFLIMSFPHHPVTLGIPLVTSKWCNPDIRPR